VRDLARQAEADEGSGWHSARPGRWSSWQQPGNGSTTPSRTSLCYSPAVASARQAPHFDPQSPRPCNLYSACYSGWVSRRTGSAPARGNALGPRPAHLKGELTRAVCGRVRAVRTATSSTPEATQLGARTSASAVKPSHQPVVRIGAHRTRGPPDRFLKELVVKPARVQAAARPGPARKSRINMSLPAA